MDFLNIPLFDDDFYKMIFRFIINMVFLIYIIRYLYYETSKRKDYLFTYFMISIIVFFLCFTLKKYELDIGMALGLFAIFGIIRYRTDPIAIKEMTYLFVVIGVSVINSLANKKMSYAEIIGANLIVATSLTIIERVMFLRHELTKEIIYEKIENIKPDRNNELMSDLELRTGLKINKIKVGKVDFLKDVALITIYYYNEK
ncbi:DUF4956 domain-containing protein [Lutimonas sp.]|uniref:DUF4956 domain-containing protein n=1 Tax=Lutimonas sp. TaxID=1872403 RepID=UPI003D9B38EF